MDKRRKSTLFDLLGVALFVCSLAFCVYGMSRLQSNTEDVVQWLPDDSPARIIYDEFEKKFGSDDFLVVTWDDCTINDPRLNHFCKFLSDNDSDELIQSVVNGADVIAKLKAEFDLQEKYTVNRFKGIFFGAEDPTQTLALIELTKKGSGVRRESLRHIESAIANTQGLELEQVVFGGYPFIAISIDNQLKDSFIYLLLPSIICGTIVSLLCLRHVLLSTIVFVAAIGASACSIAIVPIAGYKFGGLMSIIPALVYILATSGSIHLVHYSLNVIGDPRKLLSIGWRPCSISALTTAIGMLSLMRSSFPAIRNFGLFCATGAGFALVFQLVVVPWLLHRFGAAGQHKLAQQSNRHTFWDATCNFVRWQRLSFSVLGVVAMVVCAVGLLRLAASVEVEKLFAPDSAMIDSLTKLESRMGPIDQTECLIEFEGVGPKDFHVRSQLVYQIQRHLNSLDEIGATNSLQNYLPRRPSGKRLRSVVRKSVYNSQLDRQRDEFAKSPFLDIDTDSETWRISLRFPFTQEADIPQQRVLVLNAAGDAIERLMEREEFAVISSPIKLVYTGKNYLFHSAQVTLLEDLFRNFLTAFLIITPVLIVVLRSFWLGLIAMIPNLFPIVVFFGCLGWANISVDLAIAMTASVALGIAVDDTTHFLIRFREYGGSATEVLTPIRKAIAQCGPAMLHTTAIGSAGLLVYGMSTTIVVRNFSLAITGMLVLAILADIFVLPALLLVFAKNSKSETASSASSRC